MFTYHKLFFKPISAALAALLLATAAPVWADNSIEFRLGVALYETGNYEQAFYQFKSLAEKGNPDAQYNLGEMYRLGKGVAGNDQQAVAWYLKAANQGHAEAQYSLGMMYRKGNGVAQDFQQAAEWFQKSANQGLAWPQVYLGILYRDGKGVAKNYQQAKAWWQKVLAQPDTEDNAMPKEHARKYLQHLSETGIR